MYHKGAISIAVAFFPGFLFPTYFGAAYAQLGIFLTAVTYGLLSLGFLLIKQEEVRRLVIELAYHAVVIISICLFAIVNAQLQTIYEKK